MKIERIIELLKKYDFQAKKQTHDELSIAIGERELIYKIVKPASVDSLENIVKTRTILLLSSAVSSKKVKELSSIGYSVYYRKKLFFNLSIECSLKVVPKLLRSSSSTKELSLALLLYQDRFSGVLTQREMGEYTNMSVSSVNRILSKWESLDIVKLKNGDFKLRNMNNFLNHCSSLYRTFTNDKDNLLESLHPPKSEIDLLIKDFKAVGTYYDSKNKTHFFNGKSITFFVGNSDKYYDSSPSTPQTKNGIEMRAYLFSENLLSRMNEKTLSFLSFLNYSVSNEPREKEVSADMMIEVEKYLLG